MTEEDHKYYGLDRLREVTEADLEAIEKFVMRDPNEGRPQQQAPILKMRV